MTRLMAPAQWFGGKGNMVAKIIPLIPRGKVYVEPYGGSGSILWNLPPYPVEVYNDLNGDLVNLFRAIQDEARMEKLQRRLAATLYSRAEFGLALETLKESTDPDSRAWAFYVAQNQGFSGKANTIGCWSRAFISNRGMAATTSRWWSRFDCFDDWHRRIARVQIDNRDALEVVRYWDSSDTVFYLDPPYMQSTRKSGGYEHETDDAHHQKLVELLLSLKGQAVLSGYDHAVYQPLIDTGWQKISWETACYASGRTRTSGLQGNGSVLAKAPRIEVVWMKRREPGMLAELGRA